MASERATIIVAHGSRNPRAQDAHRELVEKVSAVGGMSASDAYLEMAEPSIPDAIDAAVEAGATTVVVVPCFLHPGNHVLVDIPRLIAEASSRHDQVEFTLTPYLGSSDELVPVIAGFAAQLDSPPGD